MRRKPPNSSLATATERGRAGEDAGMSQVPAATRALRVLRFLAGQPDPVTLDRLAARGRAASLDGLPPGGRDDRGGLRRPPPRGAPLRPGRGGLRGRQRLRPPGAAAADHPPPPRRAGRPRRADRAPRGAARPRRALRPRGARTRAAAAGHRRRRAAAGPPDRERPGDPRGAAGGAGAGALPRPGPRSSTGTASGPSSLSALRTLLSRDPAARLRHRGGRGHPGLRARSRRRCSTTTGTRWPGWRSPTPWPTRRRTSVAPSPPPAVRRPRSPPGWAAADAIGDEIGWNALHFADPGGLAEDEHERARAATTRARPDRPGGGSPGRWPSPPARSSARPSLVPSYGQSARDGADLLKKQHDVAVAASRRPRPPRPSRTSTRRSPRATGGR